MPNNQFIVTPWEVEGHVDYNKLTALFGTQPIDEVILARFKSCLLYTSDAADE